MGKRVVNAPARMRPHGHLADDTIRRAELGATIGQRVYRSKSQVSPDEWSTNRRRARPSRRPAARADAPSDRVGPGSRRGAAPIGRAGRRSGPGGRRRDPARHHRQPGDRSLPPPDRRRLGRHAADPAGRPAGPARPSTWRVDRRPPAAPAVFGGCCRRWSKRSPARSRWPSTTPASSALSRIASPS